MRNGANHCRDRPEAVVDVLSDVLSLARPHTYVAGGFDLCGQWSIAFDRHSGIKCYALLAGDCWLRLEDAAEPIRLREGDCVLLPQGKKFWLANDLAKPSTPFAAWPTTDWRQGIATLNGGGETTILGGHFSFSGAHAEMLLDAMPAVCHLRQTQDKSDLRWVLERMRLELLQALPGGVLVAQHLAHLLLVQALRLYLSEFAEGRVGWLSALRDAKLAAALKAIHAEPGHAWTLAELAATAGMSRSSFARTFKATVGDTPVDYVTRWRMLVAGAWLVDGGQAVSTIAYALGYTSESAFSSAFKRVMGCAPSLYPAALQPARAHPWPLTAAARIGDNA